MAAGWRALAGTSLFITRVLSVLCGLGALALVGAIARHTGVPVVSAMGLTLGCYGFVYTAAIARGFALAQLLNLAGVWLLLGGRRGFPAGLLLGAASLANYLAGFVGGAALAWALLTRRRALSLPAILGFALAVPPGLWFFLAQRASRAGQFPPFEWLPALARLGQYAGASIFGGLPLYAGPARGAVSVLLAALLATLAGLLVGRWRAIPGRWPLALCAAAPAAGLLALGIMFDNTPIELRYLAFATPFAGLLLAGALAGRRRLLVLILAIQAVSIAGLMTRPETMQPQAAAIHAAARLAGPDGIVLVPHGNDGVGIVGAVLMSAPPDMRLLLVVEQDAASLRAAVRPWPRVVLALLELDGQSRAASAVMRAAFARQECWRERPAAVNLAVYERVCGG